MKYHILSLSFLFSLLISFQSCTKEEDMPVDIDTPVLQVSISPNPTTGLLNITLNTIYQQIDINATNVAGQNFGSWTFINTASMQIEIQGTTGVYFINVNADGQAVSNRVILQ